MTIPSRLKSQWLFRALGCLGPAETTLHIFPTRGDWVVYDEYGRYDGSMGVKATKQLILECEDRLIQQPIDQLYTPGLVNLIMSESPILENLPL